MWGKNGQLETDGPPEWPSGSMTPGDTYHGRQRALLIRWEKIKRLTSERGEEENLGNAA
jgi:hypothetical protein